MTLRALTRELTSSGGAILRKCERRIVAHEEVMLAGLSSAERGW